MSLTIKQTSGGDFKPHPEGIHSAICVDVIDLGLVESNFDGLSKLVHKIKIVFETEERDEEGKAFTISKNFTASLHPKATLNKFLSTWRGKPIAEGEEVDLTKLPGAQCTLVISHQNNTVSGKLYASIDAVSKPQKKIKASGNYDGEAVRQRIAEWKDKNKKTNQQTSAAHARQQAAQDKVPMGGTDDVGF